MTFPLKTMEGQYFDPLIKYNGSPVLVIFYHTSCLGCTGRALPLAYQFSGEYPHIQLVVVHVDFKNRISTVDEINSVFTDNTPPFEIYRDENGQNFYHYNAEGTPHWLLFDSEGHLRQSIFGSQENAQNRLYYALEEMTSPLNE